MPDTISTGYRPLPAPAETAAGGLAPSGKAGAPERLPARPRRGGFFRALRIVVGFALLALGVVGLFLPVLQGVLLLLAGLAVLGRDLPWARSLTDRLAGYLKRRRARSGGSGGG